MQKTKKTTKKRIQKDLASRTGIDIDKLEKDIADVIEKHGTQFPVGTNMFQEVGPEYLKEGFNWEINNAEIICTMVILIVQVIILIRLW